jgi:ComEC/Rec2-related protein
MMPTRFITLSLAFIAGIIAAVCLHWEIPAGILLLPAVAGFGFTVYYIWRERRWQPGHRSLTMLAVAMFALPLGYWRTMINVGPPATGSLAQTLQALDDWTDLTVRGRVVAEPDFRSATQGYLRLRVDEVQVGDGEWTSVAPGNVQLRVALRSDADDTEIAHFEALMAPATYGYTITAESRFVAARRLRNPGEFNFQSFLLQSDVLTQMRCRPNAVVIDELTAGNPLTELALRTKEAFLITCKRTIREPCSRLVAVTTLGARRAMYNIQFRGNDVRDAFRHAGVGHVLAVSGLHVSIISLLLYSLLRVTGLRPAAFVPVLILFLILFALLTGARPSTVRAVIMNSVVLIAFAYLHMNLRRATYAGLALSSFIILIDNPIVLFAPSFLLSFGAVLSLVLITPVLERWICLLRGMSLIVAILWFIGIFMLCCLRLDILVDGRVFTALLAALWLGLRAGVPLNEKFPWLWRIDLNRVPRLLRLFILAQLAIQLGMMIPLSAWFFGQFPVAGILVNLIAIPAVGVLVQLGMLTGLAGLVPIIGLWLAAPLGAAATIVGYLFFWMTHFAVSFFPFPATPKPPLGWMLGYYLALLAILLADVWAVALQKHLYAFWRRFGTMPIIRVLAYILPLAVCIGALAAWHNRKDTLKGVTVFHAGDFPVVAAVSTQGRALLINGGSSFVGRNIVFEGLRAQGVTRLDDVVIAGVAPQVGNQGISALSRKFPVATLMVPVKTTDDETYLDAVGDDYLIRKAADDAPWATAYDQAYETLRNAAHEHNFPVTLISPGLLAEWQGLRLAALPTLEKPPRRFTAAARSPLLRLDTGPFTWVIVTDGIPWAVERMLQDAPVRCDVLVLPDNAFPFRRQYNELIDTAIAMTAPRVVIFADGRSSRNFDVETLVAGHDDIEFFTTDADGAVHGVIDADGLVLRGYLSQQTVRLAKQASKTEFYP